MSNLLIRGAGIAATGLAACWLLQSESSPLHGWLHVTIGNVAAIVNLPAFIVAALGSGNVHAPSDTWYFSALVVQWILYGLAIAWLFGMLWSNNSLEPNRPRG
jgi:hypothetical protein